MRKSSGDPYRCVLAKKKKKTSLFEDLHADTLMLKRRNKKLDQENKELRTAIQRLTHLIKRKDRGIYRVLSLSEHQSSSTPRLIQEIRSDMISMTSLNSRLRSMEKDLKKTEAELDELKSSTKHTRIREVQIKSEVYRDECERITRLLDQLIGPRQHLSGTISARGVSKRGSGRRGRPGSSNGSKTSRIHCGRRRQRR
mmetsp:Transcript_12632/g.22928  ORF Transcript_12632/g.22928 Transcript_12632/m.22928 type:complete len:198 (-) Transcript_12632:7-600(-)